MGRDTRGRIKGYVKYEDIFEFIKQRYDKGATYNISKNINCPLSECHWKYEINEHSSDNDNWYITSGFIYFKYKEEDRMLFYYYSNINSFENLKYYTEFSLEDMVVSETTSISLGYWGSSIEIINEIVEHFGGGWVYENDCDDEEYYAVKAKYDSVAPDGGLRCNLCSYQFEPFEHFVVGNDNKECMCENCFFDLALLNLNCKSVQMDATGKDYHDVTEDRDDSKIDSENDWLGSI